MALGRGETARSRAQLVARSLRESWRIRFCAATSLLMGSFVSIAASIANAADAPPARQSYSVEFGSEYDSNTERIVETETESPRGALFFRGAAQWHRLQFLSRVTAVQLSAMAAARFAPDEESRPYSEALLQTELGVIRRYGSYRAGARLSVIQTEDGRSISNDDATGVGFRSIWPQITLERRASEGFAITTGLGFRQFHWIPNDAYDFVGPTAEAALLKHSEFGDDELDPAEIDFQLSFAGAQRNYNQLNLPRGCGDLSVFACASPPGAHERQDRLATLGLSLAYTHRVRMVGAYRFYFNDSTSGGHTELGHTLEATATLPIGKRSFFSIAARLAFLDYLDPIPIQSESTAMVANVNTTTLDDDRRHQITLQFDHALDSAMRWHLLLKSQFQSTGDDFTWRQLGSALISYSSQ